MGSTTNWISFASPIDMLLETSAPYDYLPLSCNYQLLFPYATNIESEEIKSQTILDICSDETPENKECGKEEYSYSPVTENLISFAGQVSPTSSKSLEMGTTAIIPASAPATPGHRTSVYRGVTKHRWTGRYEAHLWDNTCRREGQKRKGRQVYLGGYDREEKAARAYDLAALKYWGPNAATNFPVTDYDKEIEEMKCMSKQEFIASIRRKSSGFSRGASIYRGVTRHHQHGRWQARIGRVAGNKDLYLGTFCTEEEAAEAYDVAAIKFRGVNAVTNFELSRYDVEAIANSDLPIGSSAKRIKQALQADNSQLILSKFINQQNLNSLPPIIPDNLLQIQSSSVPRCSLPFCAMSEADVDMYNQNFYFIPPDDQNKSHWSKKQAEGSCTLQLTHYASHP